MTLSLPSTVTTCRNLVGGDWRPSADGATIEVTTPWANAVIGHVPMSTAADVDAAVSAAQEAAARWRLVPIKERSQILFQYRDLLHKHIDRLSTMAAVEAGKTFGEAKAGVLKGIEVIEFALSQQNLDDGGALEVSRGVTCEVRREPMGVVAGITPFNFPAMVPLWMYPIAITVGNAFILKPSEKVPISAVIAGELMMEAGFPPGVFSIVHGGREAVEALIDHPGVAVVAFVGSTPVARGVYTRASTHGKRALALGGAKNHIIVVPDADPAITIDGVVSSFTGCAGQRCMAASLMVAVGDVDHLIDGIVDRASRLVLGEEMGAIIDRGALDRLHGSIAGAAADGASLRLDGRNPQPPAGYSGGNWLAPTVLDRAAPGMTCVQSELFGPVLTIVRVRTLDEAMSLENRSVYGNATSVFTTRGAVARYVSERASTGMIGVNIGVPVPREPFSFGGTKASRFGGGDITGRGGVELWSSLKKITSKWAEQPDANWMS